MLKLFAKKTRIHGIAMQRPDASGRLFHSPNSDLGREMFSLAAEGASV
jgi:hypothetical protein